MQISEDFIQRNIDNFQLFMTGSNKVYRFNHASENFILKVNPMSTEDLSPFWYSIREVFHSDFQSQRENIDEVLSLLAKNPHIPSAELVATSQRFRYQVFREAAGLGYEPDEFPANEHIEHQLGEFIGCNHSLSFDKYDSYPVMDCIPGNFRSSLLCVMKQLIDQYWNDDELVKEHFKVISQMEIAPASFSLIMPDISANQFVYSESLDVIKAVVDFDAYVIGPREWELCVIELCIKDGRAFRKGYEKYRELPNLKHNRQIYRFISYLCNPWEKIDFLSFMNGNTCFDD